MSKKNNIYFDVYLRTFLFYIICVLFAIGLSIAIFLATDNKWIAILIDVLLVLPLLVKTIYSFHHLIKYNSMDLTNLEEVKLGQVYEMNRTLAKFKFVYMGKEHYTLAIFKIKNVGDYTVDKYKDRVVLAGYSKKYNSVFLFKK
ncbi:hypothetical protein [Acholeplasma hippikon]|uniref:Uncharacterized protein n=1 Tax=Acholeplasma hippikon TaxID=264636 RepID=A0A449BIJ4_9MOLU|nr:hypothetical protein [Acholeplasma hippikon]VEU82252.1 Uncharacterised protein [Acholeplasma hippikon]